MKIPLEIAKELVFGDARENYKIVEETNWEHDSPKTEGKSVYFEFENKFYVITNSRSGSPFTDWYYDSDDWYGEQEVDEVKRVEKTILVWE